ncbi:MAG: hypothetical protein P4M02_11355, partial [Clostridia bacterium]|nr:hypothetical protein [Clostridia bacterium]
GLFIIKNEEVICMKALSDQFEGVPVTIKGETLIIPPLSFGDIEDLGPKIESMEAPETMNTQFIGDVVDIVHAAFSRNYDCTRDEVKALLDLSNFRQIIEAIKGASVIEATASAGNDVGGTNL